MSDSGLEALEAERAVEAKLAEAGADQLRRPRFSEAPEAAPDTGIPAETVEDDRPRNELGQYLPENPEAQAPVEEEVSAESAQEDTQGQDPAVQALLAKYGGDPDKALQAAVHAQRKLGEQSTELGDLRRAVDELSQLRETVQADYFQRQQNQPVDQATADWFDEQVLQNPQGALEYARQQNNNLLFQRGIDTWKQIDPFAASTYVNDIKNAHYYQQVEQRISQAQQLPQDASLHMALTNVRSSHPEYVNYDDAIEGTLARYPFMQDAMTKAVESGDRQQLEGAIETLYALAQRDTLANVALVGETPTSTTASTEVVEPTVSETHEPAPEPTREEIFRGMFNQEARKGDRSFWDRGRDTFVAD